MRMTAKNAEKSGKGWRTGGSRVPPCDAERVKQELMSIKDCEKTEEATQESQKSNNTWSGKQPYEVRQEERGGKKECPYLPRYGGQT